MTERHGISAEEAFARLRRQASSSNAGRSLARSARSVRRCVRRPRLTARSTRWRRA
ncbi:MAG: hypothetical protein ACLP4R_08050 [Solirubrobacteraceae bacterium]